MALTQQEIHARMIELRNLRKLHANARARVQVLEEENTLLKARVSVLEDMVRTYETTLTDLKLQMEELRTMVYGKKKRTSLADDDDDVLPPREKVIRTVDSYRRPVPREEEVTDTQNHLLLSCTRCQGVLTRKSIVTFFEEDIPLPPQKIVRKHIVEKGYCGSCQQWCAGMPLPCHKVTLGITLQKYVCYLAIICRLSYAQVQDLLRDTCRLAVSQGEIAKILARHALAHRPEYEQLTVRIRGEPCVGLDETGWHLWSTRERTYAWVMTGMKSSESVYLLGESRGGGNVTTLLSTDYQGYTVTDDYGGYKKLPNHQLCWAHLIRKFRDLAQSKELGAVAHASCVAQYQTVAVLFSDISRNRDLFHRDAYTQRLADLAVSTPHDPLKLRRIKTTLSKNIPRYLTCLSDASIPLTNNQSERSLRHLVLKRKISFGSVTKKGADVVAVLLSILMSRKQRNPTGYFGEWVGV